MNSTELLDYIRYPEKLRQAQADQLARVLEEYPYSGILQVLYVKALKNQNNYLYPKQLKRAAIAVPDRKALYYWVEAEVEPVASTPEKPKIEFHPEPKSAVAEGKAPAAPQIPQPQPSKPAEPASPPFSTPIKQPAVPVAAEVKPIDSVKAVPKAPAVAEGDIDLANLPASVRETVLRARRIRQQFGSAFNETAPEEKPTVTPAPQVLHADVSKVKPEPVEQPEPIIPAEATKEPAQPEPIVPEHIDEIAISSQPSIEVPEAASFEAEPQELAHEPIPKTKHSFLEWLSAEEDFNEEKQNESPDIKLPPVASQKVEEQNLQPKIELSPLTPKPSTEEVKDLYESFMEKRPKPRLNFKATDAGPIDAASLSTSDYASYITETLAQVYVKQKLYDRAINAYEILRLKYPEKSGLFAARILEIKRLLND